MRCLKFQLSVVADKPRRKTGTVWLDKILGGADMGAIAQPPSGQAASSVINPRAGKLLCPTRERQSGSVVKQDMPSDEAVSFLRRVVGMPLRTPWIFSEGGSGAPVGCRLTSPRLRPGRVPGLGLLRAAELIPMAQCGYITSASSTARWRRATVRRRRCCAEIRARGGHTYRPIAQFARGVH
jgi:hypothetical protein